MSGQSQCLQAFRGLEEKEIERKEKVSLLKLFIIKLKKRCSIRAYEWAVKHAASSVERTAVRDVRLGLLRVVFSV